MTQNLKTGVTKRIFPAFLLTVYLVWALFPIFWMIISSFKSEGGMFSMPPKFIFHPTLANYTYSFTKTPLFLYLQNSVTASFISTGVSLILGCLAGYALARGKFKAKDDISFWIISTRMAPIVVVILPFYMIFRSLHLLNSIPGLIIAYTTFNLPFAIWMLMSFISDLPQSLEEAALIEGCNKFQAFLKVTLPLIVPGLVATGILCIIFSWNDYAFAIAFTGADTQTLPVVAARLMTRHGVLWGQMMTMGTLIFIPVLFAGIAIRKYLVRGLTMGAISGE